MWFCHLFTSNLTGSDCLEVEIKKSMIVLQVADILQLALITGTY